MKALLGVVQLVVLLLFCSCQPQEQFVRIDMKQEEVLYINQLAALKVETSSMVTSFHVYKGKDKRLEIASSKIIDGESGFDYTPDVLADDQEIIIDGWDENENIVASNHYTVHVVEEPIVSIDSPASGQTVGVGESFFFKGQSDISVSSVEAMIGESLLFYTTKKSFQQPFSFDSGRGKRVISFLFKDERGRVLKQINRIIFIENDMQEEYFPLEEPLAQDLGKKLHLWSTYYYLHEADARENGITLRDMREKSLGVSLAQKDWCYAAMEGSVVVHALDGQVHSFNYAGTTESPYIDCSAYFPHKLGKTKFRPAKGEFGDGVKDYKLVPFRTIAVDPTHIAYGKVIYIPDARGNEVELPDGSVAYHDGFFFAGDTGGAIKKNHIDTFIGVAHSNPFSWVTSRSNDGFDAYIVENREDIEFIKQLH